MKAMKLRLLLMGGIISVLGAILYGKRGFDTSFLALILVGIGLIVAGLVWK